VRPAVGDRLLATVVIATLVLGTWASAIILAPVLAGRA
jgi:hypothetical protein